MSKLYFDIDSKLNFEINQNYGSKFNPEKIY